MYFEQTKKKQIATAHEDTAHTLGIVSSLFTNLPSDSPPRIRLLAKFVENNYEKVDKLLEIRDAAQGRLNAVDREIEKERRELRDSEEEIGDVEEDLWYLRRLDNGLFTLQTVDYILAWVAMEDDGVSIIPVRLYGNEFTHSLTLLISRFSRTYGRC